ncbi:MAG: zinc-finger domain-containing protein [Neisseriales bacterium]|nr:MAG: zinc-finger domain-containing protein [Neisseriales bacterium]
MLQENTQKSIEIRASDLPLQCPMPDMSKWNAHPRVFLKIEKEPNQEITCPYCSTHYKLVK